MADDIQVVNPLVEELLESMTDAVPLLKLSIEGVIEFSITPYKCGRAGAVVLLSLSLSSDFWCFLIFAPTAAVLPQDLFGCHCAAACPLCFATTETWYRFCYVAVCFVCCLLLLVCCVIIIFFFYFKKKKMPHLALRLQTRW